MRVVRGFSAEKYLHKSNKSRSSVEAWKNSDNVMQFINKEKRKAIPGGQDNILHDKREKHASSCS